MNEPSGFVFVVAIAVTFVVFGIPVMRVLHRTGFSRAWVLVMFVPLLAIVFLWIYAFIRWPVEGDDNVNEGKAA